MLQERKEKTMNSESLGFANRRKFVFNMIVNAIFVVMFIVLISYAKECYFQVGYINDSDFIRYDSINVSIVQICQDWMGNATIVGWKNFTVTKR